MPLQTTAPLRRRMISVPVTGDGQAVEVPRGLGSIVRDAWFTYAENFLPLAASTVVTRTIQIQTDAHFLCVMTIATRQTAAGAAITRPDGGSTVKLSDASAQRALSNVALPIAGLFGTAERPFVWPLTHLFRAGGGITIELTDLTAANQDVRLEFSGFKVPNTPDVRRLLGLA